MVSHWTYSALVLMFLIAVKHADPKKKTRKPETKTRKPENEDPLCFVYFLKTTKVLFLKLF